MVISVDTGNKMIKTEHYEFNSGLSHSRPGVAGYLEDFL